MSGCSSRDRPYVPLWCKSNYSFLEGASHPDELIEEAHRLGLQSLALTDRDGVYGMVRALVKAEELGIQLVVGSEITLFDGSCILLLCTDREGYANLCRLISKGRLRSPKGTSQVSVEEICTHAAGLVVLWGGARSTLVQEAEPAFMARDLRDAFGDRCYALLARHHQKGEERLEYRLRERASRWGLPLVAGMEILYHTAARRPLQDVLTCIRHGVTLATVGQRIYPNAEHALRSPRGFSMLYPDDGAAVQRTVEIAARCRFSLRDVKYRYPLERLPDGANPANWLRTLVFEGAHWRWDGPPSAEARAQMEKELALIHELQFEGYFLTMREIVQFCSREGILCQGRGSAANSVVCYCLGITAIDPIRMGLLFERFLSRERPEPPDIDLDIEHNRREEVIQHMYAKHGRTHAAMVANFIRYRSKSAVRDIGKVLGIPETNLERFTRLLTHNEFPSALHLSQAGFDPNSLANEHLFHLVKEMEDFPRHLSIHPGGFLLGHEPVHDLVPIENATMPDRTVIQWDKDDVDALGLFKVDLLGLGALNVVHRALDLIETHSHRPLTFATIPAKDVATYEMIQRADTIGTFQIESRAQMAMLPRLRPKNYYDLVVQVSIVRPGPITGGMVHPYLRRRQGLEPVTYPHPCLIPVLEKTLGIPLFQEQVMALAIVAADYTPGEADQLRRDMAAWRKSGRIERHRERIIARMMKKGIAQEFAERVFEQIRGFGEYGFPESHAASFALIAYVTAWLKCHHPSAFLCGLLNAQPMGFYSTATLIGDAKRHKIDVRPIDVQNSDWDCSMEECPGSGEGFAIRMGFRFVKALGRSNAEKIIEARKRYAFRNIGDFASRTHLEHAVLVRLAECGALRALGGDRRGSLWKALGADNTKDAFAFDDVETEAELVPLDALQQINWDYAFTEHSTQGHPIEPLREALSAQGLPTASGIQFRKNGSRVHYAGLVICRQRPGTAKGVLFMTLEDETGLVNLIVWEKVLEKYELLAKTQSFLGITGKLQMEGGVVHIIVEELWKPQMERRPADTKSRDFH